MQRLIRLSILAVLLGMLSFIGSMAQEPPKPTVFVSGRIAIGDVRVFLQDSVYIVNKDYVVAGTLIIEPGTTVKFSAQGRLVDSVGGRIIADGNAKATYNSNPDGVNPILAYEPLGYAHMNYFLDLRNVNPSNKNKTVSVGTASELTVNAEKYNYIFHVLLDTQKRKIVDLVSPGQVGKYSTGRNTLVPGNTNQIIVSYEQALMFMAARLNNDPQNFDPNLKTLPWKRIGNDSRNKVDIVPKVISFVGAPVNQVSREWGHIVVLPGARAAFFRNCSFDNFRKDTTVDRTGNYNAAVAGPQWNAVNAKMIQLTNGAGGAISTFSARTWLLDCKFTKNMARVRGGALNILQAPSELSFLNPDMSGIGYYAVNKNPNITDKDGNPSSLIAAFPIPKIDNIDEGGQYAMEPWAENNDSYRQAVDDGRLAIYLGRMRNLTFDGNYVQLASVKSGTLNGIPFVTDIVDGAADYPQSIGNHAFGGAIYIAGDVNGKNRQIEVALGLNHSMMIGGVKTSFSKPDDFRALRNEARNYQGSMNTEGSRGGAIYLSRYTSLIVAGEFTNNRAYSKYFDDAQYAGITSGGYSQGGAIFAENTVGRLQVRGEPGRENTNPTYFTGNNAGAGGAIFVDGNAYTEMSPIIGGSDVTLTTRDYGFDIKFENNFAIAQGGAILAKRNMTINGSGGVEANAIIGYDGKYPVKFNNNTAGYSGGAIDIRIPNTSPAIPARQRFVQIVRADFVNNSVGAAISGAKVTDVRGGGAIYGLNCDMNLVKGVDFIGNTVMNGNGGALSMIHPNSSAERYFISDLDVVTTDMNSIATGFTSTNDVFTGKSKVYPADVRMLTRFIDNQATSTSDEMIASMSGTGTTQVGKGTIPTTLRAYATKWVNETTGFVAGLDGLVIKLTNGGTKWEYINAPSKFRFRDIEFVNPLVGFIAGDRGVIIKTIDGGKTWLSLNTGIDKEINDIYFIGSEIGFAACDNGYILKTTNGGSTWSQSKPSINNVNSVYFTSTNSGYAVGDNGEVLFTTNGGTNWDFREINGLNTNLNKVFFRNATNGYAIGDVGIIVFTTNSGATWDFGNSTTKNALYGMYFTSQSVGYMTGDAGVALKTIDGGTTWTTLTSNTKYALWDIHFPSQTIGFMVGDAGLIQKTIDAGTTWTKVGPADSAYVDVKRYQQETGLPENGVALGGAIYILDSININRLNRVDTVQFNRVRIENNTAYTGSAIYSDNYDLKLIFNRSLITGNTATSMVGMQQNVITGPADKDASGSIILNAASSDLVGTTIYGEIQGPLPSITFPESANSIYNNNARFLVRLPDAPNTKGILAGTTGIGFGGTDTLRGNYWGYTEANVKFTQQYAINETFFIAGDGTNLLPFDYQSLINPNPADPRKKGPFESLERGDISYLPINLINGANENVAAATSIPEKLVFSGSVYDIFDKGTDIKTADYSKRRMSPIEDFAVGIPPVLRRFADLNVPSNGKYVKRWIRDPFVTEMKAPNGSLKYPELAQLQGEFVADINKNFWHPIGYPLYLEAKVNYDGLVYRSNHDPKLLNNSVFFVINLNTGDFIRANFNQVSEDAPYRETFRKTVELVPDSSNRNDPSYRRTSEGLANLGSGPELLKKLYQNEYSEDAATLQGRRYTADFKQLARVPALFSNRPMVGGFATMPTSNQVGSESRTTYFAGERYNALPVRVGDSVMVVSRTSLWRDGVDKAAKDGMAFKIVESTVPPIFTGDIVRLTTDTIKRLWPSEDNPDVKVPVVITEFLHKVFLTEDRDYPVSIGTYSKIGILGDESGEVAGGRGVDSIMNVTAIDYNNFYDPRSLFDAKNYARLTYDYSIVNEDGASALNRWLIVNRKAANEPIKDGALGSLEFAGRPINPFITPGGDSIVVFASNYPPSYRSMDALNSLPTAPAMDTISKFVETYPSYLTNQTYDVTNARFLQQDTINVGPKFTNSYGFRIFIVDSVPRFLGDKDAQVKVMRQDDPTQLYVQYDPTLLTCSKTRDGRLRANLTDKLRFQIDINTDDEAEDNSPSAAGWDYRYGRTSYGFMNKAIRYNPNDTTVFDEIEYDQDIKWDSGVRIIQTKPEWMSNDYIYKYGVEDVADAFGTDFTSNGQLNIRIPGAVARQLITPNPQYVGYLNSDTVFTVVVNDGHGGVNAIQYGVFINVQPEILTVSLPDAYEDFDYNPSLLDSSRMIKIYDPNFEQKHTFKLIYPSTTETSIAIDPCYAEAGKIDLVPLKTTPEWLRINQETGLLYGTPRVLDSPKDIKVTVLVTDEDGLSTYKQFNMKVYGINHNPILTNAPMVECIDPNSAWSGTITIKDIDLVRDETITFKLLDFNNAPLTGMKVTPATLAGNRSTDTAQIVITKTGTLSPDPDGYITVKVVATDNFGVSSTLVFRLKLSLETSFTATVRVANVKNAYQDLVFGTSAIPGVSTGDGTDGQLTGKLDYELCEIELPPVPFKDAFDARWNIPQRNGILRNIYQTAQKGVNKEYIYRAQFRAGGVDNGSSPLFPVTLTWNIKDIPALNDAVKNPAGSTWYIRDRYSNGNLFTFNMRDPNQNYHVSGIDYNLTGDIATLTIANAQIDGFVIMFDWISSVEELTGDASATKISLVSPNPVNNSTVVNFELLRSGDVTLDVVDALGNVVTTLANQDMKGGRYSINWNGTNINGNELSSGAYNLRLIANGVTSTYPVIIVK